MPTGEGERNRPHAYWGRGEEQAPCLTREGVRSSPGPCHTRGCLALLFPAVTAAELKISPGCVDDICTTSFFQAITK